MQARLKRLQLAANVAGAVSLIWLVAPLLSWNAHHPFDTTAARAFLIAGTAAIAAALWWAIRWRRSRHNAQLLDQLHERHAASDVLAERFGHAVHLLRSGIAAKAGGRLRWWQPRQMLYQLPWYMFIGAPGAGKTTALLHAGLRFPLAERLGASPVAGVGGTRQCDWWFTDQAVFIDTAGRFTTQDSHAASDAKEWQTFLRLLRRYRPVQPVNGVIVTVSVPDLLQGGAELEHQASSVHRRLTELREELGQSFPIYLLVTKSDLLSGFVEFFSDLDGPRREQLWGVVFETGGTGVPATQDFGVQLAALAARLRAMAPGRMQAEPQLQRRAAIFNFPAQVEALLPAIESFARQAFAAISQAPRQSLRGVCLSSGTQEGNPIDRVLGELSRGFGIAPKPVPRQVESGKAYFLADFLQRLVIPEAPIAGRALQRSRRVRWAAASVGAAVATALLLSCLAWVVSYRNNRQYLDAIALRVERVAREVQADRLTSAGPLIPVYALLGGLASSGDINPSDPPRGFGFGLFQGPRLAQSAQQSYQRALERTLAPLIVARLEAALRNEKDPIARYEALRVGLMLVQPARLRRDEVRRWAAGALAEASSTGAPKPGVGEQGELLRHLDALMDRNALTPLIRLDADTVRSAQASLAKIPLAERVQERIMSRLAGRNPAATTLVDLLGPSPDLILAPAETGSILPVTWEFTRQAWLQQIEPSIEPTVDEVVDEAGWVLGNVPDAPRSPNLDTAARDALARQFAQMHATATAERWDRLLARVALREPADRDELLRIGTQLSAPSSSLRLLLRQLEAELGPGTVRASTSAGRAYDAVLGEHFAAVRSYVQQAGGGAVDRLVAPVQAALADPGGGRSLQLVRELRTEAARAPQPFRGVWEALAEAMNTQQRRSLEQQLGMSLSSLAETCRRLTGDRFPFSADAKRDMPLADFARLFGPAGLLDSVFKTRLSAQVDVRTRPWRIAEGAALPERAQGALRSFEMADEIRRLFFAGTSEQPRLRLRMTPSSMDDELLNFTADIDGQVLRYENGPRRPRSIDWPGPASSQRILLRILPIGPNGVGAEVQEGPWALLRVMQRGGWQASPTGGLSASLKVDGRSMKVEVESESAAPAALLTRLSRFRCPESW